MIKYLGNIDEYFGIASKRISFSNARKIDSAKEKDKNAKNSINIIHTLNSERYDNENTNRDYMYEKVSQKNLNPLSLSTKKNLKQSFIKSVVDSNLTKFNNNYGERLISTNATDYDSNNGIVNLNLVQHLDSDTYQNYHTYHNLTNPNSQHGNLKLINIENIKIKNQEPKFQNNLIKSSIEYEQKKINDSNYKQGLEGKNTNFILKNLFSKKDIKSPSESMYPDRYKKKKLDIEDFFNATNNLEQLNPKYYKRKKVEEKNIYIPSLTTRMQENLPRYMRNMNEEKTKKLYDGCIRVESIK